VLTAAGHAGNISDTGRTHHESTVKVQQAEERWRAIRKNFKD
jgi:hypothetical protein